MKGESVMTKEQEKIFVWATDPVRRRRWKQIEVLSRNCMLLTRPDGITDLAFAEKDGTIRCYAGQTTT